MIFLIRLHGPGSPASHCTSRSRRM